MPFAGFWWWLNKWLEYSSGNVCCCCRWSILINSHKISTKCHEKFKIAVFFDLTQSHLQVSQLQEKIPDLETDNNRRFFWHEICLYEVENPGKRNRSFSSVGFPGLNELKLLFLHNDWKCLRHINEVFLGHGFFSSACHAVFRRTKRRQR